MWVSDHQVSFKTKTRNSVSLIWLQTLSSIVTSFSASTLHKACVVSYLYSFCLCEEYRYVVVGILREGKKDTNLKSENSISGISLGQIAVTSLYQTMSENLSASGCKFSNTDRNVRVHSIKLILTFHG